MEEFNTSEKVQTLFKDAGCEENENCYFVTLKDNARAKSGVVGGMEFPYDGLLINATEKGITIKTNDKKTYNLVANLDKPSIPYHNENLQKFIEKYDTK